MKKLLNADFSRLIRSKEFRICAVLIFVISIINAFISAKFANNNSEFYGTYIDGFIFVLAPYTAILSAVFTTIFIGTEFSDKTIRNKLIVGHTRTDIYISDLIASFAGSVMLIALWFIGMIPALFRTDGFEMGFSGVLEYFCIAVGFTSVFSSVFVLVGTLAPNRTAAVVIVMAVWFALMYLGGIAVDKMTNLDFDQMFVIENGKEVISEEVRNYLLSYRMLSRIVPTGQALLMTIVAYGHFSYIIDDFSFDLGVWYNSSIIDIGFSVVITVIITAVGIFFFRRKELK